MAKNKPATTAVVPVETKTADVGRFEITPEVSGFALGLGIDLSGSRDSRANLAAEHMNRSQRHMLASGLLLASIKAECEHGEFIDLIEARGFEERAARKAMQYAQFILSRPEGERLRLVELPRSKVMEIAGADPEVIESLLEDGAGAVDALSVRALRQRIQELEANLTDTQVQLETAETETKGLQKKLKRGLPDREDGLPHVVADLRAELVVMQKKAALAVDGLLAIGAELEPLRESEDHHDVADATMRLAVAAVAAVRLQLDGVMKRYLDMLPGRDPAPVEKSYLTAQELAETAERFSVLVATEKLEKAQRVWDRDKAKPAKPGRPSKRPGGEA